MEGNLGCLKLTLLNYFSVSLTSKSSHGDHQRSEWMEYDKKEKLNIYVRKWIISFRSK